MNMTGLMNRFSNKDPLRRYYVRQLRKSGWKGNAGGWVFHTRGWRVQGWATLLDKLSESMDRFARACRVPEEAR